MKLKFVLNMNLTEKKWTIYQQHLKISLTLSLFIKHFQDGKLYTRCKKHGRASRKSKNYIHALEDFIGAKISSISTSPEREDTILIEDPFRSFNLQSINF